MVLEPAWTKGFNAQMGLEKYALGKKIVDILLEKLNMDTFLPISQDSIFTLKPWVIF